jgi:hypothetical protein
MHREGTLLCPRSRFGVSLDQRKAGARELVLIPDVPRLRSAQVSQHTDIATVAQVLGIHQATNTQGRIEVGEYAFFGSDTVVVVDRLCRRRRISKAIGQHQNVAVGEAGRCALLEVDGVDR